MTQDELADAMRAEMRVLAEGFAHVQTLIGTGYQMEEALSFCQKSLGRLMSMEATRSLKERP